MPTCVCCSQGHPSGGAVAREGDAWCHACQQEGCAQPKFERKPAEIDQDRLAWADKLVRRLAGEKCLSPQDVYGVKEDCGEVFVCGGACVRCLAVRYVERYAVPLEVK